MTELKERVMKQLVFSPLSRSIYYTSVKQDKRNPRILIGYGNKVDVTQSFYNVLLQKFPPGHKYIVQDEFGTPVYEISIKKVTEVKKKDG